MEEQYQGAFLAASVRLFDVWGRARQTYFSLYGVFTSVFFRGDIFFLLSYFGGHHFVGAPTPRAASAGSRSRVLRPHRRRPEEVERFSLFLFPGCPCFLEGPREASPESNQ